MTPLQTAVYDQLRPPSLMDFHETLYSVRNHGADGGYHGFIYNADTYCFTRDNLSTILEELRELSDNCGDETLTDCLSGFRCLKNYSKSEIEAGLMDDEADARTQVYNALAWFALETVASQLESEMIYDI
jgi:hypothetical protein